MSISLVPLRWDPSGGSGASTHDAILRGKMLLWTRECADICWYHLLHTKRASSIVERGHLEIDQIIYICSNVIWFVSKACGSSIYIWQIWQEVMIHQPPDHWHQVLFQHPRPCAPCDTKIHGAPGLLRVWSTINIKVILLGRTLKR